MPQPGQTTTTATTTDPGAKDPGFPFSGHETSVVPQPKLVGAKDGGFDGNARTPVGQKKTRIVQAKTTKWCSHDGGILSIQGRNR
jgi:hypothetical protein